jgi:hypothetical protein
MALVITFYVIAILIISSAAFVSVSISQNMTADIFKRRERAFNLAESGLSHAIFWFRSQASPPVGDSTNPWGGVQNIGEGTYSVSITDLGLIGGSGTVRRYRVTSTGTYGNMNRVLSSYVQVDNYARYLWFTDRETYGSSTVWFFDADRLDGPTHTNAHFNIRGDPVFEGEVRSVDDYIRFYNDGHNINLSQTTNPPHDEPDFQQGVQFGAESLTMPSQATNLRAAATSGGLWLQGDTAIVLQSDGTMDVDNSSYCHSHDCTDIPLPANGALFVACSSSKCKTGASLTISGSLNGRLTVGAGRDIIIPGNLTYALDPRTHPESDDMLGIISERDVIIEHSTGPDLEIDGCVMALDTSFMLEDYSQGPAKGTLTVYGGIIQDERGPVGTFNGSTGQKLSGYSKDYSYDSRLLSNPPPFMPTTGDYIVLSWEED